MKALTSHLCLGICLLGFLSACDGNNLGNIPNSPAAIRGEILYPSETGEAVFYADTGGDYSPLAVVSFPVGPDGQYAIVLPPPIRLSQAGNSALLPTLPDLSLLGMTQVSCQVGNALTLSDSAARLAVLSSGQFMVNQVPVARILPSSQAVGGFTTQDLVNSKRIYAFADRAVKLVGSYNCALTRSDGAALTGNVQVDYDLAQGWNVLTLQSSQQSRQAPIVMTATAGVPSTPVQWRYFPK